jgi:hypothetical protein
MHARHFPGPWSVVDIPGGYRVQDATGHPLGYFYSWDDSTAAHQADVLTRARSKIHGGRICPTFGPLSRPNRSPDLPLLSPARSP